jgi:hypothetical protein
MVEEIEMTTKARKRMAKKKKPSRLQKLARGNTTDRLYAAVVRYVESKRGSVVVIGGISIMTMPFDAPSKYSVLVQCVGRQPVLDSGATVAKSGTEPKTTKEQDEKTNRAR